MVFPLDLPIEPWKAGNLADLRSDENACSAGSETARDRARTVRKLMCEEAARIASEGCFNLLRAIVLTGSVARDEATVLVDGEVWRLPGDADFYLVFHEGAPLPLPSSIASIEEKLRHRLLERGVAAAVGLSPVHGSYFQGLPRHIASFELRECGRVVWGDQTVLSLIPSFASTEIALEDGWRIFANRMLELLGALARCPAADMASPEVEYCTVKLYLDMATSYLLFAGSYQPTYRRRDEELKRLAKDRSAQDQAPAPLQAFSEEVSACTEFKLAGRRLGRPPGEVLQSAVGFARLLWRWELERLTGDKENTPDSELLSEWMRRQPLQVKLRGWASTARRTGWRASWRLLPRWIRLGRRASPRFWIYSVAAEALFRFADGLKDRDDAAPAMPWQKLAGRLPLPDAHFSQLPAAGWRRLGGLAALNYHRLLKDTVA